MSSWQRRHPSGDAAAASACCCARGRPVDDRPPPSPSWHRRGVPTRLAPSSYAGGTRAQLDCPDAWTGAVVAALAAAGVVLDRSAPVGIAVTARPPGLGHGRRVVRRLAAARAGGRAARRRRRRPVGRARRRTVRAVRGRRGARRGRSRCTGQRSRGRCSRSPPERSPATSPRGRGASCRTRGSRRGASTTSRCPPRDAGSATPTAAAPGSTRGSTPADRGGSPPLAVELALHRPQVGARAGVAVGAPPAVLDRGRPREGLRPRAPGCRRSRTSRGRSRLEATPARRGREGAGHPGMAASRYVVTVTTYRLAVCAHPRSGREPSRGQVGLGTRQIARARARRACCAACSALRLIRRARASWWPRRSSLRLSQARGHLRACQFFMHEIHVVSSISVGLHG